MINTPGFKSPTQKVSNHIPRLSQIEFHAKSPKAEKQGKEYYIKKYVETISRKPQTVS